MQHESASFHHVINARGTFTPLGVSRSHEIVCEATADALRHHFKIEELHDSVGRNIAELTGAKSAAVVHCTAAAITVTVAASMVGADAIKISALPALPDSSGINNIVVLPRAHAVNYGQSIQQAIRLSGATPALVGTVSSCSTAEIADACSQKGVTCLLLVSSRLVGDVEIDFEKAVEAAHSCGINVIVDGAAQDFRIAELLATDADVLLVSGQKYLAGPTSGLVLGRPDLIEAVRAQEKGIGRGMKATKEALLGVQAAVRYRQELQLDDWTASNKQKVLRAIDRLAALPGVVARAVPDPTGLPFDRVHVDVENTCCNSDEIGAPPTRALQVVADLKSGTPPIWVMDHRACDHETPEIVLELVQLCDAEIDRILQRLGELLLAPTAS